MTTVNKVVLPKKQKSQAIGVRVLRETDPRTLSREEFDSSADLLFHGSAKPVHISQDFDYGSPEYLQANDGSTTLGFGFYSEGAH